MSAAETKPLVIGRYALFEPIASGGMATVYFGRLLGPVGFSRVVAIKRLHAHFARDPEFVSMFLDEARLAARIRHPNVVPTLDVVATKGELFLVMDYVQGESLSRLFRALQGRQQRIPPRIAAAIVSAVLQGLHAAHEACDEKGAPLGIVHRDVSPQNVLVGTDGLARVLDFGIAKAAGRVQTTRDGAVKGKLAYMAPEQIKVETVTRAADIYAAGVLLWEALTTTRLFAAETEAIVLARVLANEVRPPSSVHADLAPYDDVVLRALAPTPEGRFATAREMAVALERVNGVASAAEIADWLENTAGAVLRERAKTLAQIEVDSGRADAEQLRAQAAAIARAETPPPFTPFTSTRLGLGPATPTVPIEVAEHPPTNLTAVKSAVLPRSLLSARTALFAGALVAVLLLVAAIVLRDGRQSTPEPAQPVAAASVATAPPPPEPIDEEPAIVPVTPAASEVTSATVKPREPPRTKRPSAPATTGKGRFDLGGRQ